MNISYEGGDSSIPTAQQAEYAGQYPENTLWTNLPAYGYYVRHAVNVTFSNCDAAVWPADARPYLATNDVFNLKVYGPTLNLGAASGGLILQWPDNFVLQSAATVNGAYQDVPGAPNPYTNSFSSAQQFYRLRQ